MLENSIYKSHIIGNIGEEIATKYLQKNGYKIIDRNYTCSFGELDIVAKDKKEICIIEVKTRTNEEYGIRPCLAVNDIKKNHLVKTAEVYLAKKQLQNEYTRFDVIEIILNENKTYKLNHIKQIIG